MLFVVAIRFINTNVNLIHKFNINMSIIIIIASITTEQALLDRSFYSFSQYLKIGYYIPFIRYRDTRSYISNTPQS